MAREITFGVLPFFKGAYQSGINYSKQNQVIYQGSTYQSKEDNNNTVPADELGRPTAKWDCVAKGYTDKQLREEINEYNISHINKTTYTLQDAISALNVYLGDGSRTIGLKMTYVDKASNKAKTYTYQGGSFVSTESWKDAPLGGYLKELFHSSTARYDEKTGLWNYHKLQLTSQELADCYSEMNNILFSLRQRQQRLYSYRTKAKTNFITSSDDDLSDWFIQNDNGIYLVDTFVSCSALEVLFLSGGIYDVSVREFRSPFTRCANLKEIVGVLSLTSDCAVENPFQGCDSLESIKLKGLKSNITFHDCPSLSFESIDYMVKNRAESNPITITLHPTAFDRLEPQFIADALSQKNITIKRA